MSKLDHIVIDVEIQKTIEETPGGWDATDQLGVAVCVCYEYLTDRFRIYGHTNEELVELRERIKRADRISGFNIWKFDLPVIFGLPGRERVTELLPKTNDILRRIWLSLGLSGDQFSSLHKGWGLDPVSRGTLNAPGKIANGAQAPRWYQSGEWGKLVNYCVDDVTLERDLVTFVDQFGYVVNADSGQTVKLPVETIGI
jgi:DEAD/DEAH box helicase domain-containing protein